MIFPAINLHWSGIFHGYDSHNLMVYVILIFHWITIKSHWITINPIVLFISLVCGYPRPHLDPIAVDPVAMASSCVVNSSSRTKHSRRRSACNASERMPAMIRHHGDEKTECWWFNQGKFEKSRKSKESEWESEFQWWSKPWSNLKIGIELGKKTCLNKRLL